MSRWIDIFATAIAATVWLSLPVSACIDLYLPGELQTLSTVAPAQSLVVPHIDTDKSGQFSIQKYPRPIHWENSPDGFHLTGKTISGKAWKFETSPIGLGGSIFKCDLDGNGLNDLLLIRYTGACGIAPPAVLSVIIFDKDLLPHWYELVGYFSTSEGKRKQLEDLRIVRGRSSKPFIMHQELVYATIHGKDRNYWRWHLYQVKHGKLEQWATHIGHTAFPSFVSYTYDPNHKVAQLSPWLEAHTRSQQKAAYELPIKR